MLSPGRKFLLLFLVVGIRASGPDFVLEARILQNLTQLGRIWQNLAEFGRIYQNLAEFGRMKILRGGGLEKEGTRKKKFSHV